MKRRSPSLPPSSPKGYMWLHQQLLPIETVERWTRRHMAVFDQHGDQTTEHWKNDPSYHWAKQCKEAKQVSIKIYDPDCPGCKPAAMDPTTGKVLPDSHPLMQRILWAWGQTSREQREAWHNVTCQNSRDPHDMKLAQKFINSIERM
jgi:hypothetical protein